jgi:hypothetical protein
MCVSAVTTYQGLSCSFDADHKAGPLPITASAALAWGCNMDTFAAQCTGICQINNCPAISNLGGYKPYIDFVFLLIWLLANIRVFHVIVVAFSTCGDYRAARCHWLCSCGHICSVVFCGHFYKKPMKDEFTSEALLAKQDRMLAGADKISNLLMIPYASDCLTPR